MAKRIITILRNELSKLDLPYFNKNIVSEVNSESNWRNFKLDFVIPFHSMIQLVKFCEKNHCSISFNKIYIQLTVFNPSEFVLLGLGEQHG